MTDMERTEHCDATTEALSQTVSCVRELGHEGHHEAWDRGYATIWGDDKPPTAAIRDAHAAWTAALNELSPLRDDVIDKYAAVAREYARRTHLIELVEEHGLTGTQWDPRSTAED